MKIPAVDLKIQYKNLKAQIDASIFSVIESSSFILGKRVENFEQDFAKYLGVKEVVGVGNGTDALYLSLLALGLKAGDEIITSAFSFYATVEPMCLLGIRPIFVDINEKTYNIDINKIEPAITANTKAIIPVHLYGQACQMDKIMILAKKYNLAVIEDACQAHGARFNEQRVGTFGDLACFSFFPGKNLGAYGDAGAIATNNQTWTAVLRSLRNHGRQEKYTHERIGINSRMDGIQGAILAVKLKFLDEWNEKRRQIAAKYISKLNGIKDIILPEISPRSEHIYHLFVVRVKNRDQILAALKAKGIEAGIHYPLPLHFQPALKYLGHKAGDFPMAEMAAGEVLSLPIFPELTDEQIDYVVSNLIEAIKQ